MALATFVILAVWPTLVQPEFLHDHDMAVSAVAFSPNGDRVATATSDSSSTCVVKIWDTTSQRLLATISPYCARAVEFSPDGESIIALVGDRVAITRLRNHTTRFLPTITETQTLAVCPKGILATVSADQALRFWDLSKRKCVAIVGPTPEYVSSMRVSPDRKMLAIAGSNRSTKDVVQFWSLADRRLIRTVTADGTGINDADFSPCGTLLAAGDDSRVMGWDTKTGKLTFSFHANRATTALAFLEKEHELLLADQTEAAVYDVQTGKKLRHVNRPWVPSRWRIARSADARQLFAASSALRGFGGTAQLLDQRAALKPKARPVSVAGWNRAEMPFSPTCVAVANSRTLVGGGSLVDDLRRSGLQLLRSGKDPTPIRAVRRTVTAAHSLDGTENAIVAVGTVGDTRRPVVMALDTNAGTFKWRKQGHKAPVVIIASSPNQRIAATVDVSGVILLWRTDDGAILKSRSGINDDETIVGVAVSNDFVLTIATLTDDSRELSIYQGRKPPVRVKHSQRVTAVCVDTAKQREAVVFADNGGSVFVWSLKSRSVVAQFSAGHRPIRAIATRSTVLATADASSRVTFWSLRDRSAPKVLNTYIAGGAVSAIGFSANCRRAAVLVRRSSNNGHVLLTDSLPSF